jgi:hypothetical protein
LSYARRRVPEPWARPVERRTPPREFGFGAVLRMGACSTHPGATSGTTGVDALRLLFEVQRVPERPFEVDGWNGGSIPSHSLCWLERKGGADGLWSPEDVLRLGTEARALVDSTFGVRADRGVSRADFTTTRTFGSAVLGRAFMAGMAAVEFPRLAATRRGTPPHSVWWTGEKSRKIRNRVYDKSREQGGEHWVSIRLEDQRSFPSGARPVLETVAEAEFQRERFRARFGPMRKAVDGVKAASFPVIAQALADEARYGYRTHREVERLAGALVILSGGGLDAYPRRTRYRRQAELREAGYVVVDDFMEPVEVDLGRELEAALSEFGE